LALDGIFSFSSVPLRFMTKIGLVVSILTFLLTIFTLFQSMFSSFFETFGLSPVPGYATMAMSISFLGGIQILCIGVVGEYIGRIFDEVKKRPLWIIQESCGIEQIKQVN
jgi:polyisoprenyl-phosphate glycosyltransferase